MELLLLAGLTLFIPFLVAFFAGYLRRRASVLASLGMVVIAAALLPGLFFMMAQSADGITSAGFYYVVPVHFLLSLIAAALGLHAAKWIKRIESPWG